MILSFLIQVLAVLMPSIFSDHMVLQQGRSVPVWGEAAPKEQLVITLTPEEVADIDTRLDGMDFDVFGGHSGK